MKTKAKLIFEQKANAAHNNKYTYPSPAIVGGRIDVLCPLHGLSNQRMYDHIHGTGCKHCGIEQRAKKQSKGEDQFLKEAKIKHNNFYTYDKTKYKNRKTNITITCPKHGDFEQLPSVHLSGGGCLNCYQERQTKNLDDFITEARKVHGNKYDYSLVDYKNSYTKVKIKCNNCSVIFEQNPNGHLHGYNCSNCAIKPNQKTNETFIKEAKDKHGNAYKYDKVNYVNANTKVTITCPKHGDFEMLPIQHISKEEDGICPKCMVDARGEHFIKVAKAVHGNKYDYSKVIFKKQRLPVTIICKKHGEFEQSFNSHLAGSGCSACNESKGELKIRSFLVANKIEYKREYKLSSTNYRYDFYLPKLKILIEYDGIQHFKPVRFFGGEKQYKVVKANDKNKNELAQVYNIPLIRIAYTEYNKLEDLLLFKISKIYRYRVKNKFYKNFLELCRKEQLSGDTTNKDVKKYLVYK